MTDGTERWTRFAEGNRLLLYGRGNEARVVYLDAWQEATGAGDDYCACVVARMLGVMEPLPLVAKYSGYLRIPFEIIVAGHDGL